MIRVLAGRLRVVLSLDRLIMVAVVAVVMWLVIGPLSMLLFTSLRATGDKLPFEATSFTASNYSRVYTSQLTYTLFLNTLWFAVGSLVMGLAIATTLAWVIERTNVPFRPLLLVLTLSPMAVPSMVQPMAWILLANPSNGIINSVLRTAFGFQGPGPLNVYSIPGMVFVAGLAVVPSMYLMISGVFSRMDPSLEEASEMSGSSQWETLKRVSLPLLLPGLLAAAIYYFVFLIEVFEIPAVLGITKGIFVFSTLIYSAVHPFVGLPDFGLASGYASVYLVVAMALIYLYLGMTRRGERFQVITARGYRPRTIDIGPWKNVFMLGVFAYAAVALLLPFAVVLWASLLKFYTPPSLDALATVSLSNYAKILKAPGMADVVVNTLIVSTATGTATMVLASLVAWFGIRRAFRGSSIPDVMTFAILGVPGIVVGLALLFLYLSLPIPIYGTVWIIVIGLTTRFLTYGTRVMRAAMLQISHELEEASYMSGAPHWRTLVSVVLPLVSPALLRGWLWVFVQSFRDATIVLMLMSVGTETIAARLFMAWVGDGDIVYASALAMPLVAVSAISTIFLAKWTLAGSREGQSS